MTASRWFHPRIAAVVIPGAALIGIVTAVLMAGGAPKDVTGRKSGRALGAGLSVLAQADDQVRAPFPCAELSAAGESGQKSGSGHVIGRKGDQTLTRTGHTVAITTADPDPEITLGIIADTRGASPRTLAQLGEIRAAFADAGVDLVIALGGIADSEDELYAVYAALAGQARWPVLAIPGGRAPVLALRRTISRINESNRGLIMDGSEIRVVRLGKVAIATLPGVAERSQLVAGDNGCIHTSEDADAVAQLLDEEGAIKVWASYAPPRQIGATGSDVAAGGIHIGERILAGPVARSHAALVLSALVDEAALASGGGVAEAGAPAFVAAGAAAALPVIGTSGALRGSAVTVTISGKRVRWHRIAIPLAPG